MPAYCDRLFWALACHFLGDYVLQTNMLARTKGKNAWHMIAQCFLYTVPFAIHFGLDLKIPYIFVTHVVIDTLKAKYHVISYTFDQAFHIVILIMLYTFP